MTTRERRNELLCGRDVTVNRMAAYMVAHGWTRDTILQNSFRKIYEPNQATVWLEYDEDNAHYYANGQYDTAGVNELATCLLYVKAEMTDDELEAAMAKFLASAEKYIERSYARQCLGPASKKELA